MGNVNAIRRMMRSPPFGAALLLAGVAACAPPPPSFPDLARLSVATQVTTKNMCSLGVSPEIRIRNAPAATARYRLRMSNIDVLFGEAWQITTDARPGGIPAGVLPDYPAPCLGAMEIYSQRPYHLYRFEVFALDPQDQPLAYGEATVPVYGVDRALALERAAAAGQRPALDATPPITPMARPVPTINPALVPPGPEGLYQR